MAELQALFAAASEEDFDDSEDTGVLPGDVVKSKKEELKIANADWKAHLKAVKDLAGNIFSEIKVAALLPKGADTKSKGFYCSEGLAQKQPVFENGQRILDLAAEVGFTSEYAEPLKAVISQGKLSLERAQSISQSLVRHKVLEDEVKALKTTIKGTENKRDELVESARAKITNDEARTVIIARLKQTLLNTYHAYLRADQRACIKAIENLWSKYAVTAKTIEAERDAASAQLQAFMVELGYE